MKFRAAHKLATYLMVASAITNLQLADSMPLPTAALFLIVAIASWFTEPGTRLGDAMLRLDVALKVATLAFFGYTVLLIYRLWPDPEAQNLVDLIVFLLGLKLMQRRTNRDYLTLFILSFMVLMASAWLAQSAMFALGFAIFVITSTWALILFHLRREIEDNYLVKHSEVSTTQRVTVARVLDSRRVVSGKFFAMTALSSVGVLLGAVLVFALAPRIGLGFLTGGVRRRTNVAGFNDEVRLGHHGTIDGDNNAVVLRATLPRLNDLPARKRDATIEGLYWRGTVYDTYVDGQWLRSREKITRTRVEYLPTGSNDSLFFVFNPEDPSPRLTQDRLDNADEQNIQVVGLSHPVAFALDSPIAFKMPRPALGAFTKTVVEGRYSGESALRMDKNIHGGPRIPPGNFSGASYIAYSHSTAEPPPADAPPPPPLSDALRRIYLTVPSTLTARTRDLARKLTESQPNEEMKVRAVVDWLHRNKQYSTDLKRDESIPDPVEDFLFKQQQGHCEYFASSAALMLRTQGIPTRYVNGFLGGEWNAITSHVTIRDNRAHSWIETYLDGRGWTRWDATPPALRTTTMGSLTQIIDSIELWWARWVIEYSAAQQVQLGRDLAQSLGLRPGGGPSFLSQINGKKVLVGVVLFAALVVFVRELRRRQKGPDGLRARSGRRHPALAFYARALVALGRMGVVRTEAETPRELLARARRQLAHPLPALASLTRWYERARFGEQEVSGAQLQSLEAEAATLERLIAELQNNSVAGKRPAA